MTKPAGPTPQISLEKAFDLFQDVMLPLNVDLGKRAITIRDILALTRDEVLELPKSAGDNMDIKVKDVRIALGELFVIEGSIGIRITEILSDETA